MCKVLYTRESGLIVTSPRGGVWIVSRDRNTLDVMTIEQATGHQLVRAVPKRGVELLGLFAALAGAGRSEPFAPSPGVSLPSPPPPGGCQGPSGGSDERGTVRTPIRL